MIMTIDVDDGADLKCVFESDDGMQQQSPPKRPKTKYEGLKGFGSKGNCYKGY